MAEAKRTCRYCGREVGVTEWQCPACGKALVAQLHINKEKPAKPTQNTSGPGLIVVGLLIAIFVFLAYQSWVYPNMMVDVEVGEVEVCVGTGERRVKYIERKKVRRKEAQLPRNSVRELYINCESGSKVASVSSDALAEVSDISDAARQRTSATEQDDLAATPDRGGERPPAAAADLPYEPLDLNMTNEAVVSAWGAPLKVEYMVKGSVEVERWYYGDPLYGLLIFERYVDFKNGRVIGFHTDTELTNLYEQVLAERREGVF